MRHFEPIKDILTGEPLPGTEENKNLQLLVRWLLALGYEAKQIQTVPQYRIRNRRASRANLDPRRLSPVDLAVFRGADRNDDDLLIIGEVKSKTNNGEYGVDQLRMELNRTPAVVGVWFNGEDLVYVFNLRGAVSQMQLAAGLPAADRFAHYLANLRLDHAHGKAIKNPYSLRAVARRVGIEASYLSKIERGAVPPPSVPILLALAEALNEDPSVMLLRAGQLPRGVPGIGAISPGALALLLQGLATKPTLAIEEIARKVKDGDW